jgi:hypothetical protein
MNETDNPYNTPESQAIDSKEHIKTKKPLSIKATQVILILFIILITLGAVVNLSKSISEIENNSFIAIIFPLLIISILILIPLFGITGLNKRKKYGAWLSAIMLIIIPIFMFLGSFVNNPNRMSIEPGAEQIGALLARITIFSLFAVLVYKLIFSKNVKQYLNNDV